MRGVVQTYYGRVWPARARGQMQSTNCVCREAVLECGDEPVFTHPPWLLLLPQRQLWWLQRDQMAYNADHLPLPRSLSTPDLEL